MSGGLEVVSERLLDLMKKGVSVEEDVRNWFDFKVPKPTVPRHKIAKCWRPSTEGLFNCDSSLPW